jgi:transcriptional regulator with XRE-family HTH domain
VRNTARDYQKAFGKHVRGFRDEKEWSQAQLGTMAGLQVYQISRIENGRFTVTLKMIRSIAVALGKHPRELLNFKFDLKLNTDFSPHHQKRKTPETTAIIHKLLAKGFFNTPRSVAEVVAECKLSIKVSLRSSAVSGVLGQLYNSNKLKRIQAKDKRKYLYQKRSR